MRQRFCFDCVTSRPTVPPGLQVDTGNILIIGTSTSIARSSVGRFFSLPEELCAVQHDNKTDTRRDVHVLRFVERFGAAASVRGFALSVGRQWGLRLATTIRSPCRFVAEGAHRAGVVLGCFFFFSARFPACVYIIVGNQQQLTTRRSARRHLVLRERRATIFLCTVLSLACLCTSHMYASAVYNPIYSRATCLIHASCALFLPCSFFHGGLRSNDPAAVAQETRAPLRLSLLSLRALPVYISLRIGCWRCTR